MKSDPHHTAAYYERCGEALGTALGHVAAYRSWQRLDPGPSASIDERFAAMPALTKKDIRELGAAAFVPAGRDFNAGLQAGEISLVKTSGSIDVSVTNIWHQVWWDASERASWKLNAHAARLATGDHPEAILSNPMNVGIVSDDGDLPMEKRRLARFLYLNEKTRPDTWPPSHMDRMLSEIRLFRPAILEANPSLLARLCRHADGRQPYQPGLITFTYEYPAAWQLRQVRRVFGSPLASSYGTTETGYVFMQCEAGKLHQNTESCRVDFQPLKREHGGPQLGRILVTTFGNPWYRMLRFDVGDLARIDDDSECECGRSEGMILSAIEGRAANCTFTTGGRLVTPRELDLTLLAVEGIDEFRLDQTRPGAYELHLASRRPDRDRLSREITAVLRDLYGHGAAVEMVYEAALAPESSGKYCVSKSPFAVDIERCLAN
jgi:phenylacetate-coenzyme A ligase PaaK-like adenylate-forming protein